MFRLLGLSRTLKGNFPGKYHAIATPTSSSRANLKFATSCPGGAGSIGSNGSDGSNRSNESSAEEPQERKAWTNKHGEEILYKKQYPPRGYIFIPAGNPFITRHCRVLAQETKQKIYAYYRLRSKRKQPKQLGLYLPKEIVEKVRADYKAKKKAADGKWLQKLNEAYPKMPTMDKAEIRRRSRLPEFLKMKSNTDVVVLRYVQERYTKLDTVFRRAEDPESVEKAHQEAARILSKWRGKD